jgi:CheY-like chemotaxis protein
MKLLWKLRLNQIKLENKGMERKILVIDDDELILMIHEAVLENNETESACEFFDEAGSALLYMEKMANQNTQFLLLLDINMPFMSGWDLLEEISETSFKENVFAIMVTSSVNSGDQAKAEKYKNVCGFISKPLKDEHFGQLRAMDQVKDFFGKN